MSLPLAGDGPLVLTGSTTGTIVQITGDDERGHVLTVHDGIHEAPIIFFASDDDEVVARRARQLLAEDPEVEQL